VIEMVNRLDEIALLSYSVLVLSCKVVPVRVLKILGGIYIVLGVMSFFMLVVLTGEYCKVVDCTLGPGGNLAIGAFFEYGGAGLSTF
jgi:hypothetical protein